MADKEEILIEVKFDSSAVDTARKALQQNFNELQANKKELREIQKEVEKGNSLTEAGAKRYAELNAKIEENKRAIKSNTAIVQAATAERATENDSLDMQRQYLNTLQKAYAGLTAEQKEAMGGTEELEKAIKAVSDSLKEQEHAIGDDRRNVGNYAESIQQAFGEMAHAGELLSPAVSLLRGMGGEGQKAAAALDALSKVMQLAGKASKVLATARSTEQAATEGATVAQNGLNAAMAANPIGLIIAGISTLLPLVQSIINAFGDASSEIEAFNNELERQSQLIDQLQADAQFEAKVAGIMGASAAEQLRIQRDAAKKAVDIAQQRVDELMRIQLEGSKKERKAAKENMDEAESQLKAAQDRLNQLNQQATLQDLADKKKAEDDKLKLIEDANKKAQEANAKAREEEAKREREFGIQQMEDRRLLVEANMATELARQQELKQELEDALAALDEDEEEEDIKSPDEMARDMFGLDAEGVEYFKSLLDQGVGFAEAKTAAIADQTKRITKGFADSFGALGGAFDDMANMLGEFAGESAEAAAAQKAFSFMGILLNQAQAISNGALAIAEGAASAASIPFPGNIPAIISIVAQITSLMAGVGSSIAQAKQIFSQAEDVGKFEQGGIVPGTSYSGDKLTARVNSREMILPMEQQKVLFDALSSSSDEANRTLGIDYSMIAAANASIPPQVLVLKELRDFEDKVVNFEEIAKV